MKKTLAMLLVLLLAASAVTATSCSGESNADVDATTPAETENSASDEGETTEQRLEPDLPDITFTGESMNFYGYRVVDIEPYFFDIYSEGETGEPLNDAVFQRNRTIEERYDITINYTEDYYTNFNDNIKANVMAGDNIYDVLLPMGHCFAHLYSSNVFYNLHDIEYLNFENPWWDQKAVEAFTLAGYMPVTVSDININSMGVAAAVFFNKKLVEDYDIGNLYEEVYNNTWTIETMIQKGKLVSDDLNGDSKFDDNDRYGIVCYDDPVAMLFASCGGTIIDKDADGYPVLSFATQANFDAIQYYLENLMYDELLTRNNTCVPDSVPPIDLFKTDHGLFYFGFLEYADLMRDMESDFGILPVPKYSTEQEYRSVVSVFDGSLIAVPVTVQNTEKIGIILEAMSAESMYTVVPALYETVLKDKATRDQESIDMLDIIINNKSYDVGHYFDLAGFPDLFLRITGSVHDNNVDASYPARTSNIASFYEKYEKKLDKALEKLIKIIDDWNGVENQT